MNAFRKAYSKDKIPGGLADKKKPSDFDPKALSEGVRVEMEHTNDEAVAREIAMDHLTEDPEYYKKLKTIEKAELRKSPYGPQGMGLYNQNDNARRKMSRTSETAAVGPNKAVQSTKPSAKQQAASIAADARKKSKANPVKVYTQAEIAKLFRGRFKRPGLAKAETLEKRSKNVRRQTRNLTSDQRNARFNQWLRRQGMNVKQSNQDRFGVGPKQNTLLYSKDRGMPEHEYAHHLMTPEGKTPRQYQKELGQVTATSAMTPEARREDEATAFMMQPLLARRAGVSAQDTKNVGMMSEPDRMRHSARAKSYLARKVFKSEDLDKMGMAGDWKKEGFKISHEFYDDDGGGGKHVHVKMHDAKGNHVGSARFQMEGPGLYPAGVAVDPSHQRKGAATAMYSYAEKLTNKKVVPSSDRTDEGKALWRQTDRPFGLKGDK